MAITKRLVLGVAAGVGLCALAFGYVHRARAFGVPTLGTLAYTGSLFTFGLPDNGTHQMSVALWLPAATTAACASPTGMVQTVNGQFSIPLPPACVTVIHQNPNVQVQLTVDSTMLGLTPLAAVPYALEAASVTATSTLANIGLAASVASSALTITLTQSDGASAPTQSNPAIIGFGLSAPASGSLVMAQVFAGIPITVPSSASLGQPGGVPSFTYVYAQDDNGTVQLCVSSSGTLDEGAPQSAGAISSGSTSPTALYCSMAALGPVRLVGRVLTTETTPGVWTTPTGVSIAPFSIPALPPKAPTITRELSGSGTYTTPTSPAPLYLRVRIVGGGGGGGGGGTVGGNGGGGGTGGTTSFGPLSATGGNGGGAGSGASAGGTGGGTTVGSPAVTVVALTGSDGAGGSYENSAVGNIAGGSGGSSPFGGSGGGVTCTAGQSAISNSGSGGAGGGTGATATAESGSGGGSGGYIEAIISSPAVSYAFSVGGGGGSGAWNSSDGCGGAGGAGGSGVVIVEEYYQ